MQSILIVTALLGQTNPISPREAVALATADILTVPPADQPFTRYIWFFEPSREEMGAVNYALNSISSASTLSRGHVSGRGHLLRIDIRRYVHDNISLVRWHSTWEKFASLRDSFTRIQDDAIRIKVKVAPYVAADGKTYDFIFKDSTGSTFSLHTGMENMLLLASLCGSDVPLVNADIFVGYSLRALDGGLYYDFKGWRGKNQTEILAEFGASVEQVARLRSDERAALFRSGVTDSPRRINVFFGSGVRPSVGAPLVAITEDIFKTDADPARHAIYNLLDGFTPRAKEILALQKNGMVAAWLVNSQGELQDAVPQTIASDDVAFPHANQLQPIISCIRCHGPNDMFQPFTNSVQTLSSQYQERPLGIVDDLSSGDDLLSTLDRLRGLYSGDLSPPLAAARRAHNRATFRATDGMRPPEVAAVITRMVREHEFDDVTPKVACYELGHAVDDSEAVAMFNRLVPPVAPAPVVGIRRSPEDPAIAMLRNWKENGSRQDRVTRRDWSRVYGDAAMRAMAAGLAP